MLGLRMLATGALIAGCAHARSADEYRAATAATLSARQNDLKSCYDQVLTTNPHASGRVTVKFAVEEKTGLIRDVVVDPAHTTAPHELSQCVVAALPAASVSPPDRKRGDATWSWEFSAQPAPANTPAH